MKKTLFYMTLLVAFVSSLAYFTTNRVLLECIAKEAFEKYQVSFKKIDGDIFSSISVFGVKYKDKELAKKIYLKYSLKELLDRKIHISKLKINSLNIDNMLTFQKDFSKKDNKDKKVFGLYMDYADVSIDKFIYDKFKMKDIKILVKDFVFKGGVMEANSTLFGDIAPNKESSLSIKALSNIRYDTKQDKLSYKATIYLERFKNIDTNITKLLKGSKIVLKGDNKSLSGALRANGFKLFFDMKEMAKYADMRLVSDMFNSNMRLSISKSSLKGSVTLPKNSTLNKRFRLFFPIKFEIDKHRHFITADVNDTFVKAVAKYNLKNHRLKILSKFEGGKADIYKNGSVYNYKVRINSLNSFVKRFGKALSIKTKYIDGDMSIKGEYGEGLHDILLTSSSIKGKNIYLRDINASMLYKNAVVKLDKFHFRLSIKDKSFEVSNDKKESVLDLKSKSFDIYLNALYSHIRLKGFLKGEDVIWDTFVKSNFHYKELFQLKNAKISSIYKGDKRYLSSDITLLATSRYIHTMLIKSDLKYFLDKEPTYSGVVEVEDIKDIDKRFLPIVKGAKATFSGTQKDFYLECKSDKANLAIKYKKETSLVEASLKTKVLRLKDFIKKSRQDVTFSVKADTIFRADKLDDIVVAYKINSNIINFKGRYLLKEKRTHGSAFLSENSLLKGLDANFKIKKLFPFSYDISKNDRFIKALLKDRYLKAKLLYDSDTKDIKGSLKGFGVKGKIWGDIKRYQFTLDIDSLRESLKKVKEVYRFGLSKEMDTQLSLKGKFFEDRYDFVLKSPWYLYRVGFDKFFFVKDINADFSYKDGGLFVNSYQGWAYILDKYRKLYSRKLSTILLQKSGVKVDIYLNDEINIAGVSTKNESDFHIKSSKFHLKEPEADIECQMDLKYMQKKNKPSIEGKIYLLGGKVSYKPKKRYEISDKDIIFVNHRKIDQKEKNADLKILVNIISKTKMEYVEGKNRIYFKNDITLFGYKGKKLGVYGYVDLLGGVYESDGRKFEVGKGRVIFDGDVLNPYLNLKAYYKKEPYKITIFIGGKLSSPVLNFSSEPYLSQNDILSILIFNSKFTTLSRGKTAQALSLFGNSFAKGISDTLGIGLDRVELLTTKEGTLGFEIEKRLTDKISIVYQDNIVQSIKLRYKNTDHIETDVTIAPNSSGIEILYR
ncbi:MAG: hypothetical protein GXO12_01130 [Epsilonproteobacteria bacterium]|nr:hypothetical protein [Campylobacterota bacterium]